jgi:hypothetical protein
MAAKLTRLTHKIAIQLHLAVENCIICSSRSRWPVRKLLDTRMLILSFSFLIYFPSGPFHKISVLEKILYGILVPNELHAQT